MKRLPKVCYTNLNGSWDYNQRTGKWDIYAWTATGQLIHTPWKLREFPFHMEDMRMQLCVNGQWIVFIVTSITSNIDGVTWTAEELDHWERRHRVVV